MGRCLMLVSVLCILVACGGDGLIDEVADKVPATTGEPVASAEMTDTPTNTPAPAATPVPEPAPTIPPRVVPETWHVYEHPSGWFSIAYPPTWTIEDERTSSVRFDAQESTWLSVGVMEPMCGTGIDGDDDEILQCLTAWVGSIYSDSLFTFELRNNGEWDDGIHRGFFVEYRLKHKAQSQTSDVWTSGIQVFILISDEPTAMTQAVYSRTSIMTPAEPVRSRLQQVMATYRLRSETGE